AQDPAGRVRQVKLVFGFDADADAKRPDGALARLRRLRHALLPPVDWVIRHGRLVGVGEPPERTLADVLKERQKAGGSGRPRDERLDDRRDGATALDELYREHKLRHLCLSPRQLQLFADGGLRLADFGLAELVWLPAGQAPGTLNTRYSAPELFEGGPGPA